jgi:tryptophan synthase beta chain
MTPGAALVEIEQAWRRYRKDPEFVRELRLHFARHAGRPTPLTRADRLADRLGGGLRLYLKREDLTTTGTTGLTVCLGHALLASRLRKTRFVGGAGTGGHGVAVASAAEALGLQCVIYLCGDDPRTGESDLARMRRMGAEIVPIAARAGAIEDADLEAERDWADHPGETYLVPASRPRELPYAGIERDLEGVIGHEARAQILECEGRMPDALVASVGRGYGALGLFQAFLDDREVLMVGVDAEEAGPGTDSPEATSAKLRARGGLPDRARALAVTDAEALAAGQLLAATEGILPGPGAARAVALVARLGRRGDLGRTVLIAIPDRDSARLPMPETLAHAVRREAGQ